uniref:Uncharacterized protein n=1 Tax=Nothobranchius furzeri TaxID=105023 RepID=A0A8C6LTC1_NOTFU
LDTHQTGKNDGYRDGDVCGFCPTGHCCIEGGAEKLDSVVNMKIISKAAFVHITSKAISHQLTDSSDKTTLRLQIQSLKEDESLSHYLSIVAFPNQVMNTDLVETL